MNLATDPDVLAVLRYVSNGRSYVGVQPYPDAAARRALGRINEDQDRTLLTPAVLGVLRLYAQGLDYRGVAAALVVSPWTVRSHTSAARKALGVNSTKAAVEAAKARGLLGEVA